MKSNSKTKIVLMGGNLIGCNCLRYLFRLKNTKILLVVGCYNDNGSVIEPKVWNASLARLTFKKNLPFVQLQGKPFTASPKEHLYEQMRSNPAFTERNKDEANAYPLDSHPEQNCLVTYHSLPSLYVCVWLVNTLTSTAPTGSPIICI